MPTARPKSMTLRFPVAGLNRRAGFQSQAPYTTSDCQNVRPIDVLDARERGGRRPGLTKAYASDFGVAIQLLCEFSVRTGGAVVPYLLVICDGTPTLLTVTSEALDHTHVTFTGEAPATITGTLQAALRGTTIYLADPSDVPMTINGETGVMADIVATAGAVPTGNDLICLYRDRLVLAGADNVVWFSRTGDPADWGFDLAMALPGDSGNPIALSTGASGETGHRVRALVRYGDQALVIGTEHSLWRLSGEPGAGGTMLALSKTVGIVAPTAWCMLPDTSVVFLSRSGLMVIPPGSGGPPVEFSEAVLPDSFRDVDLTRTISMCYDEEFHGVHVSFTPASGVGEHWWIDMRNKSFWPVVFGHADVQPTYMLQFGQTLDGFRRVLCGGRDGYLRYYDRMSADDDGNAFTGYVVYGPFRGSGDSFWQAMVQELTATLDRDSADVTWTILSGTDCQAVVEAPASRATGTWGDGRNRNSHPRVTAGAFGVKVSGAGIWSMETIGAVLIATGRQRL